MFDLSILLSWFGHSIVEWLGIFAAPLQKPDMLWIIVPVWGVWIFSEFYQEKKGTSFGNAISNGATMLFVGVDWMRYVIRQIASGEVILAAKSIALLAVAGAVLFYGLSIIILGIKGRRLAKVVGRVRETTYFMVMFSPVIYGVKDLTVGIGIVIAAFFPLFYILVEIIDRLLPTPQAFDLDEESSLDKEMQFGTSEKTPLQDDFTQSPFKGFGEQNPPGFAQNQFQAGKWQGRRP